MARENNFLLGHAERLSTPVTVKTGGQPKKAPYTFSAARTRASTELKVVKQEFKKLPDDACPNDEAVAVVTLHPRYVSKSDYPDELFRAVGVRAVGSKPRRVSPKQWGVSKAPQSAVGEDIFVAGQRAAFDTWAKSVAGWTERTTGAKYLVQLEEISPFRARDKMRGIADAADCMLEVVLHTGSAYRVIEAFEAFASRLQARAFLDRCRTVGGLTFLPVLAHGDDVENLASFTFVRVARGMPTLRPFRPSVTRIAPQSHEVVFPDEDPLDQSTRAVVFDGGLPSAPDLSRWVTLVEPDGIGPPKAEFQAHGLAVTSALLFGNLDTGQAPRPLCAVDHVRVLDDQTGLGADLEYFDVLDRITKHLDAHKGAYDFHNFSVGPDLPVEDDDVTAWTAELDKRFENDAGGVVTVAVGNEGDRDPASGLNRIQPPADGVNVLAVGAADGAGGAWKRAGYSSVGPGRCPGVVKPDGVAFGGSVANPFHVLAPKAQLSTVGTTGTSFAAPFALRSGVSVRAQLGGFLTGLATRALLIHRTAEGVEDRSEIGWGRFEEDPLRLITCEDTEAIAIYQGNLPVGRHLRSPVPMPGGKLNGSVTISATMLISPEVEPEHPGSYTKSGVEVVFRPNMQRFKTYDDGTTSSQPEPKPFFNQKNMYAEAEYQFREDGHKWEPCLSSRKRMRASSLLRPCFDIYYHRRDAGTSPASQSPIPYALVVTLSAPKVADLYNRVVRAHAGVLVPIQPRIHIPVRV